MPGVINRDFFFTQLRNTVLGGKINPGQVDGSTAILDYWEQNYAKSDDRWLAYILGTAYHETAHTMKPIKEFGGNNYFKNMYDIQGSRPQVAKRLGNLTPGDGVKYYGRGFVQVTGKRNYQDWTNRINKPGVNLVNNPDKALDTRVATVIIVEGMVKGSFTGKKLSQYFSGPTANWTAARAIVNGTDRALMIGDYGQKFYAAISYTV